MGGTLMRSMVDHRPSAMRRSLRLALLVAPCFVIALGLGARASAEWRPSGAITGDLLIREGTVLSSGSVELGGGVLVDLWQPFGVTKLGFAFGIQGLGGPDDQTRIFTPIAASFAVGNEPRPVGAELRLRAGAWTGATNSGFAAGPLLTAGAYLTLEVDPTVRVALGMEGWFMFGHGDAIAYAPSLSLAWTLDRE